MKIRVDVTMKLTDDQVENLVKIAESCGHGHDMPGKINKKKLIKRLLTSKVTDTVYYAHEQVAKEIDNDGETD